VNWQFVRREWGAVTFVLTVIVGMIIVPLALFFTNQAPTPVATPIIATPTPVASPAASGARSPSPSATTSPSASPTASPSATPT
jgi:hypothetical protein